MRRHKLRSNSIAHHEEPLINLTPLIDVVFVILIMFIVIAPVLDLDRVELAEAGRIPGNEAVTIQESSPITLHVHRNNSISLNNQPVTLDQLPPLLKQAKELYPHARPQLFHDKQGHFGVYQGLKNVLETAGFQQLDIVLKPSSE